MNSRSGSKRNNKFRVAEGLNFLVGEGLYDKLSPKNYAVKMAEKYKYKPISCRK